MNLKRTRNKLLKNGFIPKHQSDHHDQWMDLQGGGTDISFYHDGETLVDGALRVHGKRREQYPERASSHTRQVKLAINLSRV